MITVVDYGMGNLRSVEKAIELYTSNEKICEKHIRRKSKVFWATVIVPELVGT